MIMLYLSMTSNAAQNTTYPCKGLVNAQLSLYMSIPKILMIKGGLLHCQKDPSDNLHNHLLHGATRISQCIKSKIDCAVTADWSDAEINGLEAVVGHAKAMELLKGCKVHWQRSCQRVADRVATSSNRKREKDIFVAIASQVQKLESACD